MDYDVIVRIPIRARDMEEAYAEAAHIEDVISGTFGNSSILDVECTGASGEE